MKPCLSLLLLSLSVFITHGDVLAVTPACYCSASSVEVSVSDALGCFEVSQDTLDVCYGDDVVIRVDNRCDVDVLVTGHGDVSDANPTSERVSAGSEHSWQERFEPTLNTESETRVTMSWALEAEGVSHSLELSFTGSCTTLDEEAEGGCQSSPAQGSTWPLVILTLLGTLVMRRRSTRLDGGPLPL